MGASVALAMGECSAASCAAVKEDDRVGRRPTSWRLPIHRVRRIYLCRRLRRRDLSRRDDASVELELRARRHAEYTLRRLHLRVGDVRILRTDAGVGVDAQLTLAQLTEVLEQLADARLGGADGEAAQEKSAETHRTKEEGEDTDTKRERKVSAQVSRQKSNLQVKSMRGRQGLHVRRV